MIDDNEEQTLTKLVHWLVATLVGTDGVRLMIVYSVTTVIISVYHHQCHFILLRARGLFISSME